MNILGIDPGKNGAVVLVETRRKNIIDVKLLKDFIAAPHSILLCANIVAIERPLGGPRTHTSALMQLSHQVGYITGIAYAQYRIPVMQYTPAMWQGAMLKNVPAIVNRIMEPFMPMTIKKSTSKLKALLRAQREFPEQTSSFMVNGKYHDGIIDAALIAAYAIMNLGGDEPFLGIYLNNFYGDKNNGS